MAAAGGGVRGEPVNASQPIVPESITLATLAQTRCWVAWQTEDRADGKPTKVPYATQGTQ